MPMALVLSAPLAVVSAYALLARPSSGQPLVGRGRIAAAIGIGALLLCLGETIASEPPTLDAIARNLANPPDCRAPPGLQRLACFQLSPQDVQTAEYVRNNTAAGDPVFIGLDRHDMIFDNDVTLWFAIDRPSPTKWHQFDPGLQTTAPIQREMVDELQRSHPKLVVLQVIGNPHEPNASALSSGVLLLDDYIRQTYDPVATFGTNTILRRKTS
jgi:hypothetical protein